MEVQITTFRCCPRALGQLSLTLTPKPQKGTHFQTTVCNRSLTVHHEPRSLQAHSQTPFFCSRGALCTSQERAKACKERRSSDGVRGQRGDLVDVRKRGTDGASEVVNLSAAWAPKSVARTVLLDGVVVEGEVEASRMMWSTIVK